jgi:hypothetical protein
MANNDAARKGRTIIMESMKLSINGPLTWLHAKILCIPKCRDIWIIVLFNPITPVINIHLGLSNAPIKYRTL